MKKKMIISIILVVVLGVGGFAGYNYLNSNKQTTTVQAQTYISAAVTKRTLEKTLTGSGSVETTNTKTITTTMSSTSSTSTAPSSTSITSTAPASITASTTTNSNTSTSSSTSSKGSSSTSATVTTSVTVTSINVTLNQNVAYGDTLITLSDGTTITAPYSGIISNIDIAVGDAVKANQNLITTSLTVASINVAENQTVNAGDTLVTLSNGSTITATYGGIISNIAVALGDTLKSGQNMITTSFIVSSVNVIANQFVPAGYTLFTLSNGTTITAPFDGIVSAVSVSVGDTIKSGQELGTIFDSKHLIIKMDVDETDLSTIAVGQAVDITLTAYSGKTFQGTISAIGAQGSYSNGSSTFPVTISLNDTTEVKIGMSAETSIKIASVTDALSIPVEAVKEANGKKVVMVAASDGTTKTLEVETGVATDTYVEIKSGLTEGESVQIIQRSTSNSSSSTKGMNGTLPGGMQGSGMPSGTRPSGSQKTSSGQTNK